MSIVSLARADIRRLKPYASARSTSQGLDLADASRTVINLDANENPWPPDDDGDLGLNRYPDPQPAALRAGLADLYGVPAESVLVTRGSDEAIDLLVRAFCRAGIDSVAQCSPCFGMYAIAAAIQGARLIDVPLSPDDGFALPAADLLTACQSNQVRLVFLCSPNNPTGNALDANDVRRLCKSLSGRALVVLDEAYGEFNEAEQLVGEAGKIENLAVLRTLSKAWGLAGARCGALVAAAKVIDLLRRIIPPYPLPTPSVRAAEAAIARAPQVRDRINQIVSTRQRVAAQMAKFPWVKTVWPSQGNFLLVQVNDARSLYEYCALRGVLLRDFSASPALAGCIRISIGTPAEMARLVEILEEWRP